MSLSAEKYANGGQELQALLNEAEEFYDEYPIRFDRLFSEWLERAQEQGWTRRDVYLLVHDACMSVHGGVGDLLAEVETAIIGYCSPNCIFRFPGDPVDGGEFVKFVRSKNWL